MSEMRENCLHDKGFLQPNKYKRTIYCKECLDIMPEHVCKDGKSFCKYEKGYKKADYHDACQVCGKLMGDG
jgi:hypothetical protein